MTNLQPPPAQQSMGNGRKYSRIHLPRSHVQNTDTPFDFLCWVVAAIEQSSHPGSQRLDVGF
jgi:hypothetical protein